ncbi:HNH endonuclease [Lactiplantibacillus plantarum]|uniref:HNH endonuclease n=1 Tax=Lactiplantibacillus plantarum TaxID=1590 RepID=UPI00338EC3EE
MAKGKYTEWLTPESLIVLEGWARDGLTDAQIAQKIGIRRPTLYDWKKKYPDISDALKKGKEVIDRQVENALLKKALGYTVTETTRELIDDKGQNKRHDGVQPLTASQWTMCKSYFQQCCAYCGNQVKLTKDHLKPLENGGRLEVLNVIPACQSCNSSKKDHEWLSWFENQPFYDPERAQKIADYTSFIVGLDIQPGNGVEQLTVTKEVTKHIGPDTGAIALWLKNRKPEDWFKTNPADKRLKDSQSKINEAQVAEMQNAESNEGQTLIVDDVGGIEDEDAGS